MTTTSIRKEVNTLGRHAQPAKIARILRSSWLIAVIMVAAVAYIALFQPLGSLSHEPEVAPTISNATGVPTSSSSVATEPAPTISVSPTTTLSTATAKPRTCRAGVPLRLTWNSPGIKVDALIEKVGLDDDGNLGAPDDKKDIGWYSLGPKPGEGKGNVLIDGHTYTNNSAVFKENFALKVTKGMTVSLIMDNGSTCSYKITKIWPNIQKKGEYPQYVAREKFYDFNGPEQLFGVTCSGSWNAIARSHEAVTAFMAMPIN